MPLNGLRLALILRTLRRFLVSPVRLFLSGWLSAEVVVLQRYGPITDEGVVVGGAFDSDTAVGKCRLRTRAAGVLASR